MLIRPTLTISYGQIPTDVARREDSWRIVKDVVRNVIDGQPKKGDFWDDANNGRVFAIGVQDRDDAVQAYGRRAQSHRGHRLMDACPEALEGRNWYDIAGGTGNRNSPRLRVACTELRQGACQPIFGSTVPANANSARSMSRPGGNRTNTDAVTHGRTSSTSSTVQVSLSPVAAYYGLRAPTFGSPIPPQISRPMGHPMAANMALPTAGSNATGPSYPRSRVGRSAVEPGPSTSFQASAPPPRMNCQEPARYHVRHCEIIIRNLQFEVTENMLTERLTGSIGPVERCRIERREGRKCHAFVTFAQAEHAQRAVGDLDHSLLFGREVTVRLTADGPVIVDGSMYE
ncbi:MAG: hypothetical protein L6R39_001843 [Caloplaca ligustica]|nr:MAG: hypothetical protein L6R39_001843 [Caloplaca ligustica]